MAFDNTKYDIELNGLPHRIKGYVKAEAPAFVPRVGSGGQSESEFNLLLSKTIDGFEGGILQRFQDDNKSYFGSEGLFPIYDDGVLYPVNSFVNSTGLIGKSILMAHASYTTEVYLAYRSYNTPTTFMKARNAAGTETAITCPATLQAATVTDMIIHNNYLYVSSDSRMWYGSGAYTMTEITGGGFAFDKMVSYKGSLYGTDTGIVNGKNSILYRYTGDFSTRSAVEVGRVPNLRASEAKLLKFNNRIILLRNDGMFAYSGVGGLDIIEDASDNVNDDNYRLPVVLKGYLYYFMPDGWYRYNGSLIEKLYDSAEIGRPVDVIVGKGRIWLLYANSEWSGSSRYDKAMGYDYSSGNSQDGRVAVFNGKAMYTYGRMSTFIKNPGTIDFSGQDEPTKMFWFKDKLFVTLNYSKNGDYHYVDTNEKTLSGTKTWRLVTSIMDMDFPMVDKNFDNLEVALDGTVVSEAIAIEYRTSGFDGSGTWTSAGSFNTTTELKRYIWKTLNSGLTAKRVQFRLSGTTTAGYGLAKLIVRYTLSPDFKWQWTFTVLAYGDDPTAPLLLSDGSSGTQAVRAIRGNIYAARSSDVPVKFVDLDQLDLNGGINAAVTSVVLNSTSLLKGDDGFIQIDDEIMYWYAKTSTTLTVVRGVLGTSAASHSDNSKVFIVYRVLVSQINPERIINPDDPTRIGEDKSRASEITLQLREV